MKIGFNLPHLAKFSRAELQALAAYLPKGLTYRLYGGEETRTYEMTEDMLYFLKEAQGRTVVVFQKDSESIGRDWVARLSRAGVTVAPSQWENELYSKVVPIPRTFFERLQFLFARPAFERDFYRKQGAADAARAVSEGCRVFNIPVMVTQNANFMAYAEGALSIGATYTIDLHVYGRQREGEAYFTQLRENLAWIKGKSKGRPIEVLEYNPTWHNGPAREFLDDINTPLARSSHDRHMAEFERVGIEVVLWYCLASNAKSDAWSNYPYFNYCYVDSTGVTEKQNLVFSIQNP